MNIVSFILFNIPLIFSPGPNNIMCLSSGVNFGYKNTLPHILGISLGYPLMILIVSLGFGILITKYSQISFILKYLGGAYLFYLAWKIANSAPLKNVSFSQKKVKPLSFWQALIFQWVNPKAWAIIINILAMFTSPKVSYFYQISLILIISILMTFISTSIWALFGMTLNKLLTNKRYNRMFNIFMAFLIIVSFFMTI